LKFAQHPINFIHITRVVSPWGQIDITTASPKVWQGHAPTAPLGLAFNTGSMFPASMRGDAFVRLHQFLIAMTALPLFVWWELKIPNPIINLRLFKDSAVQNGTSLMFLLGFFLYSVVFLLPVFLGRTYHYDATQIGAFFIPGSLLTMAMMPIVGKLMQSGKNPKVLIMIGFLSIEICLFLMTRFSPLSPKAEIMRMLYVRGFAMAFLFVPINSSILSQYKGINMGQVAGMMNLFRQIGGSVGIALVATLLNLKSHQNYADLQSKVTALSSQTSQFSNQAQIGMNSGFSSSVGMMTSTMGANVASTKVLYWKVQNQVFMMSFLQLIYFLLIVMSLFLIPWWRLRLKRMAAPAVVDAH
jgi:DHA2 family multidrug resistance protein